MAMQVAFHSTREALLFVTGLRINADIVAFPVFSCKAVKEAGANHGFSVESLQTYRP